MTVLIQLVLLYVCWFVVVVRLSALRRPDQRPLWFALLMLGIGITMQQKATDTAIEHVTGNPNVPSLISSLMAVGVAATLLSFTLGARQADKTLPVPYARARLASWALTAVTMIVTFSLVTGLHLRTRAHFLPIPGTLTVHSVYWATYLTYMLVVTTITATLLVRTLPRIRSWLIRTPVLFLAIATTTFIAFLVSRVVAVFTYSSSPTVWGTYISSIHTTGVAVGCSIAAFLPAVHGLTNRRDSNALYPLWKALCTALPHIALYPPRSRLADALIPQNSQFRLYRRLIEIRDGMLIMREWVGPHDLDAIKAVIRAANVPDDQVEPVVTACWLRTALLARDAGLPGTDEPLDLLRHGGSDVESELRWLRRVAKVWSTPLVRHCATTVHAGTMPASTMPASTMPASTMPADTGRAGTGHAGTVGAGTVHARDARQDAAPRRDREAAASPPPAR